MRVCRRMRETYTAVFCVQKGVTKRDAPKGDAKTQEKFS